MSTAVDVATLDLIENALLNARFEMDEVVRRAVERHGVPIHRPRVVQGASVMLTRAG